MASFLVRARRVAPRRYVLVRPSGACKFAEERDKIGTTDSGVSDLAKTTTARFAGGLRNSGGGIRTRDLRVMSQAMSSWGVRLDPWKRCSCGLLGSRCSGHPPRDQLIRRRSFDP